MLAQFAQFIILFAWVSATTATVIALCPNRCSGHGMCADNAAGSCHCFPGYSGGDCSLRLCAAGTAWVDFPSGNNIAHAQFSECSNMGTCDRSTGICKCRSGYSGAACDIMLCPVAKTALAVQLVTDDTALCSGNGRCMSLRDVNLHQDYLRFGESVSYTEWDADLIHGCVCDQGWEGVACEKRSCPRGDDPLTTEEDGMLDDIQLLDCACSACTGGLHLTFQGQQTQFIPYDASEKLIEFRLKQLSSLTEVEVKFRQGNQMCSAGGTITQIRFRAPSVSKSPMILHTVNGLAGTKLSIRWNGARSQIDHYIGSVVGTREYVECSNHGICDYSEGICQCFGGYASSDGLTGGPGNVGDCGYRFNSTNVYKFSNSTATVQSSCPFEHNALCSGNGTCHELSGMCKCNAGYGGPACANLTCATTFTWFGKINQNHVGASVCGGVGNCDGDTGRCRDCGGNGGIFTGDKCEYLSCAGNQAGTCSQNGACLTMRELAKLTYNNEKELAGFVYDSPWDADHIRGCACTRSISVDNQYDPQYRDVIDQYYFNRTTNASAHFSVKDLEKFYRGPFAMAATDFKGYDCQSALCPKGDNPRSRGVNEIQELHCLADNGTFRLTFRENTTTPISYNATTVDLKHHLEQIYTISKVDVWTKHRNRNHSVCNVYDNITIYIEFLTETGDLPLIVPDVSGIRNIGFGLEKYGGSFVMNITEFQKGTKSDLECSSLGLCDEATGRCTCFDGFGSSNGTLTSPGERGDCSFFNPLYTEKFLLPVGKK